MNEAIVNKATLHNASSQDGDEAFDFKATSERLKKIITRTPLSYNAHLSKKYACNVFLKREDLQVVRSFKIRGAYNMMSHLSNDDLQRGVRQCR